MRFANPLNLAYRAMQTAEQALQAAEAAQAAAAEVFPYALISSGSLLAELAKHSKPLHFSVSSAGSLSDMPDGINGGVGCEGFAIFREDTTGNAGVFLWQARDAGGSTRARLWFRTFRDVTWTGPWKLLSATDA